MDTCSWVPDPQDSPMAMKVSCLKAVTSKDGVHATEEGYKNLACNLKKTILGIQEGSLGKKLSDPESAAVTVSGAASGQRHFWRGFCSPVGSKKSSGGHFWPKLSRDRSYKHAAPYFRRQAWRK